MDFSGEHVFKTFGDLMSEYERTKDDARRFGAWDKMDKFVAELVNQVSPKVEKPLPPYREFAYDDMGTALPIEDDNG